MRFVPSAGADTDEEVAVPMGNPDPAREPSMEEILASIRQIISDDSEDETLAAEEAGAGRNRRVGHGAGGYRIRGPCRR